MSEKRRRQIEYAKALEDQIAEHQRRSREVTARIEQVNSPSTTQFPQIVSPSRKSRAVHLEVEHPTDIGIKAEVANLRRQLAETQEFMQSNIATIDERIHKYLNKQEYLEKTMNRKNDDSSAIIQNRSEAEGRLDILAAQLLRLQKQIDESDGVRNKAFSRIHNVSQDFQQQMIQLERNLTEKFTESLDMQNRTTAQEKQKDGVYQNVSEMKATRDRELRDSRISLLEQAVQTERSSRLELEKYIENQLHSKLEAIENIRVSVESSVSDSHQAMKSYIDRQVKFLSEEMHQVVEECQTASSGQIDSRQVQGMMQSNMMEQKKIKATISSLEEVVRAEIKSRLSSIATMDLNLKEQREVVESIRNEWKAGTNSRLELLQTQLHEIDADINRSVDTACTRWCNELNSLASEQVKCHGTLEELLWSLSSRLDTEIGESRYETSLLKSETKRLAHDAQALELKLRTEVEESLKLLRNSTEDKFSKISQDFSTKQLQTDRRIDHLQNECQQSIMKEMMSRMAQHKTTVASLRNELGSAQIILNQTIDDKVTQTAAKGKAGLDGEISARMDHMKIQHTSLTEKILAQDKKLTSLIESKAAELDMVAHQLVRDEQTLRIESTVAVKNEIAHRAAENERAEQARICLDQIINRLVDDSTGESLIRIRSDLSEGMKALSRQRRADMAVAQARFQETQADLVENRADNQTEIRRVEKELTQNILDVEIFATVSDVVAQLVQSTTEIHFEVKYDRQGKHLTQKLETIERESLARSARETEKRDFAIHQLRIDACIERAVSDTVESMCHIVSEQQLKSQQVKSYEVLNKSIQATLKSIGHLQNETKSGLESVSAATVQCGDQIERNQQLQSRLQEKNQKHMVILANNIACGLAVQSCVNALVNRVADR